MTFDEFVTAKYPDLAYGGAGYVGLSLAQLHEVWTEGQKAVADTGPAGIVKPLDMKYVPKKWGWELWICNNDRYCGKKLFIKQGHWLSYHHHEVKDEVLYIESGKAWITYDGKYTTLFSGFAFHVKPGVLHQIQAIDDATIFEFSTKHFDEDSHRRTTDLVINHEDDGK